MDKIEKIRQGIKRLRKEIKDDKDPLAPNQKAGYLFALADMESLLDTLSKEPSKSLQEEIETWIPAHISIRTDETLPINPTELAEICKEWGKCIARHFAEWGAEHLRDSTMMIDKSLEEAADEHYDEMWDELGGFAETRDGCYDIFFPSKAIRNTFIAGAEWQASQMPMPEDTVLFNKGVAEGRRLEREDMLKDAEECELSWAGTFLAIDLNMVALGYSEKDKVKVIVLKAEEE